jgi:hypothetical protein
MRATVLISESETDMYDQYIAKINSQEININSLSEDLKRAILHHAFVIGEENQESENDIL